MTEINPPLLLNIDELNPLLENRDDILLVAVCQKEVFQHKHIPGSVLVEPAELVSGEKPAVGKLPPEDRLNALFSRIGLSPDKTVIAYDDEGGGWAGRLIWTLDVIGHQRYAYLDGGLVAWLKSGYPVTSGSAAPVPTSYQVHVNTMLLRNKEFLLTHLDEIKRGQLQVWDARASQEYTGDKITAIRNGHIPGACNLDWLDLMDRENDLRLLPKDELLQRMHNQGIRTDVPTITHCQTHHRSGLTYLVGKLLGMDITAYDGSWSEWGNDPDTPITTGQER
jgi:thiosulfate/3-mercaptopyruvate sulfurtransferase